MQGDAQQGRVTEPERLGRYQLIANLAQGGMGAIHLAIARGTGGFQKLVVLKELRRDLASNSDFVELFLREAKLAGRLNHVNVVQTLEAGHVDDRYFLAMEFLEGQSLAELLGRAPSAPALSLQVRLSILCQALAGLHYAHELQDYDGRCLGIVHRDVSPSNVFVTYDGRVKVVDFGIAKAAEATSLSSRFKGKIAYAAPEQVSGSNVDRRADIFSMGVMLWEAITLRRFAPLHQEPGEIVHARLEGKEPRLAVAMPEVDPALAALCDRALRLEPAERFATAEEFRRALSEYAVRLGPKLEPDVIGKLLCEAFAEQRALLQRVVNAGLGGSGPQSGLQFRPLGVPRSSPDGDTPVADLSRLVEITRDGFGPRGPLSRGAGLRPKALAAALGAVGALSVLAGLLARGAPEPPSPSLVEPTAEVAPGAIPARAGPGAPSSPLDEPSRATSSPRGSREPPVEAPAAASGETETVEATPPSAAPVAAPERARPQRAAPGSGDSASPPPAQPAARPSAPRPAPRRSRRSRSTRRRGSSPPEEPKALAPPSVEAAAPKPAPSAAKPGSPPRVRMGDDLRGLRKHDRAGLETDNPFR